MSEEHREDGLVALAAIKPWRRALRRERSARVWQAAQCWALLCTMDAVEAKWAAKTRACPELVKHSVQGRWHVRTDDGHCP